MMEQQDHRNSPTRKLAVATQVLPADGSSGVGTPSRLRVRRAFMEERAHGRNDGQLPRPDQREAEERRPERYNDDQAQNAIRISRQQGLSVLSGEAGGMLRPPYEQLQTSDAQATALPTEKRHCGFQLRRESNFIASVKELQRREEPALPDQEPGGSPSRSRSAQRTLPASALTHSAEQLMYARSLRGLARRNGSRAMISNSYRILDKKRVSHEDVHRPYAGPGEPIIKVPPSGADRRGRAPVSVSMNLQEGLPKSKFLTMPDAAEGRVTGELISLQFGCHDQSKSPSAPSR